VPTVAEQGIPGFEALAWWGMFAPARTPPAIVQRINAEVAAALRDPAIRDRLVGQGMNLLASAPEELARFLDPQMTRWAGVVREYGIRAGD
jgi:tripartite-type tricarboxylate transporter receptor subunit TctC